MKPVSRFFKPIRMLPTLLLALLALSACDSVTQAPVGQTKLTPANDQQQRSVTDLQLSPASAAYSLPAKNGTKVQIKFNSAWQDQYGWVHINASWWGQNYGYTNLSVVQFRAANESAWRVAGGKPYISNGRIYATYGINPRSQVGPLPWTQPFFDYRSKSRKWYFRVCSVANNYSLKLSCAAPRMAYF